MADTIIQSVYFDQPGPQNTARTLEIARQRANDAGQGNLVATKKL